MITGQGENGAISILAKQFQGYTTLLSLSDPNDDDDDQIGEEKAGRLHRDGGMRPANPSVLHHIPPKNIPRLQFHNNNHHHKVLESRAGKLKPC